MARRKATDQEQVLSFPVRTRVREEVFKRLEKMSRESNCRSVGELVRKILSQENITVFHKDASMNGPMEQLILLHREIKAIGVNINQVTRQFHQSPEELQKLFYASKISRQYELADVKMNLLLSLISQLSKKWLQK
ncbi:hypothetical protein ADIARSV_0541 [Arcticibacter svalbardensis MN12-7]|uniref:Uncharacterized protein n=1 Tax=Arcticibacter svalbardensis MN12-7 TaxID=1150600 RepID=R9GX21_9SPHI|nr:plasmid mobilization relaxosome protein MobC [Arcticibacter svalbardensis]EOR96306.1 hypothetical protein ADIARSV_0541 [Arcticibacter svalbardensis MN12-7]